MKRNDGGAFMLAAILVGIAAGVILGGAYPQKALKIKFLGELFLNALRSMIVPLVVASMITGITGLGDVRKIGKIGTRTVIFYILTTAISVTIGIVLVNLIGPGRGFAVEGNAAPAAAQGKTFSFIDVLMGMVPPNLFEAMAKTNVLPLIVFSLFFGGTLTTIGEKGLPVIAFFEGCNAAIMKLVHLIMYLAPLGIFALIAARLGEAGGWAGFRPELTKLMKYAMTVIIGLSLHAFVALPLVLFLVGRRNPLRYLYNMLPALTTAFSTASSSATLPVTIECVEERNGVSNRTASFVLPLGATVNMDGTALYEAVAAIFIAQAFGVHLDAPHQVIVFLTATLAAIGAAGIPEAGLVTMVIVLQAVGLPIEGIGLLLSIDWFLDRCRTTVNVWGDAVGAAVIEHLEGKAG
ncbi:MAG: dicarboxylate/amino acid:cation symporter [Deltaproteobacteria bacterium]|nr:MAG: dicarboxylate/amino acid:cation symporter [Deltaproteobacteria bacterium]